MEDMTYLSGAMNKREGRQYIEIYTPVYRIQWKVMWRSFQASLRNQRARSGAQWIRSLLEWKLFVFCADYIRSWPYKHYRLTHCRHVARDSPSFSHLIRYSANDA